MYFSFILFIFLFFFLFWLHAACVILALPGSKPIASAVEAWSLNHWITREVPHTFLLETTLLLPEVYALEIFFGKFWLCFYFALILDVNSRLTTIYPSTLKIPFYFVLVSFVTVKKVCSELSCLLLIYFLVLSGYS